MKRRPILVAGAILALGLGVAAAPAGAGEIRIGGVININRSSLTTDHPDYREGFESSVRSGFGGVLEVGLLGGLSVVTEPMVVGKGARVETSGSGATGELELDYFEVPLYVKLRFGGGSLQPYLFAGPALGFETGGHRRLDVRGPTGSYGVDENLADRIEGADASLAAGGGVAVKLSGAEVFVEAAQSWGLRDVGDVLDVGAGSWPAVTKTKGIQVRFGVTFKIG